jgi:hypothetical protein
VVKTTRLISDVSLFAIRVRYTNVVWVQLDPCRPEFKTVRVKMEAKARH